MPVLGQENHGNKNTTCFPVQETRELEDWGVARDFDDFHSDLIGKNMKSWMYEYYRYYVDIMDSLDWFTWIGFRCFFSCLVFLEQDVLDSFDRTETCLL